MRGLAVAGLVAGIAAFIGPWSAAWGVSASALALLIGLLVALVGIPASWRPGLAWTKHILLAGVLLLAFLLPVQEAVAAGPTVLGLAAGAVVVGIVATYWIAKWLGASRNSAMLLGIGTGVCGASAILALRSAVGADEDETAGAVAVVVAMGTLALLFIPFLALLLGLSAEQAGLWAGATIHAVPQAVGAGVAAGGDVGGQFAALVKMGRVAALPLVALALAGGARLPKEVVWFLAAAILGAVTNLGALTEALLADVQRGAFLVALAGLGLQADPRRLAGHRLFGGAFLGWAVLAAGAGLVILATTHIP